MSELTKIAKILGQKGGKAAYKKLGQKHFIKLSRLGVAKREEKRRK